MRPFLVWGRLARASLVSDHVANETLICPLSRAAPTAFAYYLLCLPKPMRSKDRLLSGLGGPKLPLPEHDDRDVVASCRGLVAHRRYSTRAVSPWTNLLMETMRNAHCQRADAIKTPPPPLF